MHACLCLFMTFPPLVWNIHRYTQSEKESKTKDDQDSTRLLLFENKRDLGQNGREKMLKKWNECMSFNDVARVDDAVPLVEE